MKTSPCQQTIASGADCAASALTIPRRPNFAIPALSNRRPQAMSDTGILAGRAGDRRARRGRSAMERIIAKGSEQMSYLQSAPFIYDEYSKIDGSPPTLAEVITEAVDLMANCLQMHMAVSPTDVLNRVHARHPEADAREVCRAIDAWLLSARLCLRRARDLERDDPRCFVDEAWAAAVEAFARQVDAARAHTPW